MTRVTMDQQILAMLNSQTKSLLSVYLSTGETSPVRITAFHLKLMSGVVV
jgi:hypothetical protein